MLILDVYGCHSRSQYLSLCKSRTVSVSVIPCFKPSSSLSSFTLLILVFSVSLCCSLSILFFLAAGGHYIAHFCERTKCEQVVWYHADDSFTRHGPALAGDSRAPLFPYLLFLQQVGVPMESLVPACAEDSVVDAPWAGEKMVLAPHLQLDALVVSTLSTSENEMLAVIVDKLLADTDETPLTSAEKRLYSRVSSKGLSADDLPESCTTPSDDTTCTEGCKMEDEQVYTKPISHHDHSWTTATTPGPPEPSRGPLPTGAGVV